VVTERPVAVAQQQRDVVAAGVRDREVGSRISVQVADRNPDRIEPGAGANLAILDLEEEWKAGAAGWESRSGNSCFAARMLKGRVLATVVAGQVAYRNRAFAMGAVA